MKNFEETFLNNGFVDLGSVLDKERCQALLKDVYKTRNFGHDLFITENEHRKNPRWSKTNPGPGINLTEKFDLDFIEKNNYFQDSMEKVLGPDYNIMLKKFVVGVPTNWVPKWIYEETKDQMTSNLGPYIKPIYHDMTYFRGIDFHQDIIDHKSRISDFITLYIYLDDVQMGMSPLVVIPGSHQFGATTFPHNVNVNWKNGTCVYSDTNENSTELNYKFLTGNSGQIYFWSALTLHGTQSQTSEKPRISLRYLIERSKSNGNFLIDKLNDSIKGNISLEITRHDLNEDGKSEKYGKILKS